MPATLNILLEHFGDRVLGSPSDRSAKVSYAALITYDDEARRALRCAACPTDCAERIERTELGALFEDDPDAAVADALGTGVDRTGYDEHESETLYIGTLESALYLATHHPSAFLLAVVRSRSIDPDAQPHAERMIVVHDERPLAVVFEEVRRLLLKYEQWISRMRTALFKGTGYQGLLDASAGIFEDFISITDSSYQLLAYTKDVAIDDPVAVHLVKEGCHAQKTVEMFKRLGAVKRWQTQVGIMRVETTRIVADPTLSYVFRMQGSYFVHVVLQCNHSKKTSSALVDTFQMLIDHLELYVRHDWSMQHSYTQDYAALLNDLLLRRPVNRALLDERLAQAGIAYEGSFLLCAIEPEDDDEMAAGMIGYYAHRLCEMFPLDMTVPFQGRLLVLSQIDRKTPFADSDTCSKVAAATARVSAQLKTYLDLYGGVAGVSDAFDCITDIASACKQARMAIEYGKRDAKTLSQLYGAAADSRKVHLFAEHFADYAYEYGTQNSALSLYCARRTPLEAIRAEDAAHNDDDARILYAYLANERRANEAAAELHLHRNTLLYRIRRLEARYAFDLNDRAQRERLLAAFHLMPV